MKTEKFEMVAKTFQGLEDVLADELIALGADNVTPGRRMVSFSGDMEMLYRANLCCRTALRILKPIYKFTAADPDRLYEMTKEFDWGSVLGTDKTFSIDPVVNSDTFTHSRYVTYRVKDAIVDYFKDRFGEDHRPGIRLQDADVMINVHIDDTRVTLSLDSSGESLHRRGYRVAQTEAPINEVLAAGIILKSGWRGDRPFVDPMCGSGTFLIEAAMIAANINPGVYRHNFAFENWSDFDEELFERLYNDDSNEREVTVPIIGADISPKAIAISERNIKQAGVAKWIDLTIRPLAHWTQEDVPAGGVMVTNPPYGERISVDNMEGLYELIGKQLKHVFKGYDAWIIGYNDDYFKQIGLTPSVKIPINNGGLECELREYEIFEGDYRTFRHEGGELKRNKRNREAEASPRREKIKPRRLTDEEWRRDARKHGFGGKDGGRSKGHGRSEKHDNALKDKYKAKSVGRKRRYDDDDDTRINDRRNSRRYSDTRNESKPKPDYENPLAARRNEQLLKEVLKNAGKPASHTFMRQRRKGSGPDEKS